MQDSDDNDAIVAELIKESVRKTLEENASKGAMHEMKSQRIPPCERNCIIDRFEESIAEIMGDFAIPQSRLTNISFRSTANDDAFDHSF
jgi:hypothetical protein